MGVILLPQAGGLCEGDISSGDASRSDDASASALTFRAAFSALLPAMHESAFAHVPLQSADALRFVDRPLWVLQRHCFSAGYLVAHRCLRVWTFKSTQRLDVVLA
jgi:hypothetical protein